MIVMDGIMARGRLRHTRDYLTQGIGRLIRHVDVTKCMPFPNTMQAVISKFHLKQLSHKYNLPQSIFFNCSIILNYMPLRIYIWILISNSLNIHKQSILANNFRKRKVYLHFL